ncbi:winged helix-turn-helix domain-containing protein [Oceanospirillum sediminis]|uniref:Winged helix-turn-helix domain-containing protein n=1 Tax=Oceanospirillum sediminis TaxID=2760088 RepID=A0A839IR11_9GAMM|nr:winged helix-turn-helix domain-containing protein [Oceanospirillum sediminis]MBB1487361.1 winged helix-turn-helix domain-containing protein [Oceanospirillum sediminis]
MLRFNQFCFDPDVNRLTHQNEEIYLRQKLIQLLRYLLAHRDRAVSKEELLREIWQHGEYRERSLAQSILELRKALGDSASAPRYIRTIPQQGYQWICPVQTDSDDISATKSNEQNVTAFSSETTSLSSETVAQKDAPSVRPGYRYTTVIATGVMLLLSLLLVMHYSPGLIGSSESQTQKQESPATRKVLILPFKNSTHTTSMQWVEYGLSDMLASDLMSIPSLQIYTPAQSARLLASQPSLQDDDLYNADGAVLKQILSAHQVNSLIVARIRLEKHTQLLDYRIVSQSLAEQTGSLSHNDLAVSMPDIARHLYQQLIPDPAPAKLPEYHYKPSAMHDYARGVQALQLTGPALAQHYFAASTQIDPNHLWSEAYLAVCMILLGEYDRAEQTLTGLNNRIEDPALKDFVKLWLSQLWLRSGEIIKAEQLRQQIQQQLQRLNNYRTSALSQDLVNSFWYENNLLPELMDFSTDAAGQHAVSEESLRHLSVLGQTPALMIGFLIMGSDNNRPIEARIHYLTQSLEYAKKLQQPYEQALIRFLRARLTAEQVSYNDSLPETVKQDLKTALALAEQLKAGQLQLEIQHFQATVLQTPITNAPENGVN